MSKHLVVVESPAKAKTIKKYLGKDFMVLASYGHVRDLPPKNGSVLPNEDFKMHYQIIERNAKHVDAIAKALESADDLYLASDPDREGEAISWHISELLKKKKKLKDKPIHRVVFHEITKNAIREAIEHPREISINLINAQQARRALDYLVGFNLSPLLWKKIRRGLSAGRVQSPALRMIVEREIEIEKFEPQEYWTVDAELTANKTPFQAKLTRYENDKVSQFTIHSADLAEKAKATLTQAAQGHLVVAKIDKKQRKRNPAAPFITSTLQQEAGRKLGFTAQRTMRTAQQLYEAGYITYMRTDSVNLANEAIADLRDLIEKRYGKSALPDSPRTFKTKAKNAQEAHEAIRPTACKQTPEILSETLDKDQMKLYQLIWKRTVACQMIHATLDTVAIDLSCTDAHTFRANGSTIKDPGFLSVYYEDSDDGKAADDNKDKILPVMQVGDKIPLKDIIIAQHFTEPPPRYTEASLIKALEEFGIGRPSTYASIISTLQHREYAILDQKRFRPTDVGRIVNRFLTTYFNQYVDYDFTANLENKLDEISLGERDWLPVMHDFWTPFIDLIQETEKNVKREDVTQEAIDEKCPECGEGLTIRLGRRGRFIGCSAYPDCSYTRNLETSLEASHVEDEKAQAAIAGRNCPECKSDLVIRNGRYGKFIGCSNYPNCKFIEPLEKPEDTDVDCPKCKQGKIFKRKSRRGKIFFSCGRYPDCDYAIWNEPLAQPCPNCSWPILTIKTTKKRGTEKVCPQKDCNFSEVIEAQSEGEDIS